MRNISSSFRVVILVLGLSTAQAEDIAVIGTGMMGGSLGPRLAAAGHTVIYGSRSPGSERVVALVAESGPRASAMSQPEAAHAGRMVIIAVPWKAVEQVVRELRPALAGKIVIDITNAQRLNEDDGLPEMAVATSGGELVQGWLPRARVVKAFNTVGFHVVAEPDRAGGPVTVPVAGDHLEARQKVMGLVRELGFDVMDAGPMRMARTLERLSALYRVPHWSQRRDASFEYYFRPVPEPTPAEFPVLLMQRD